MNENAAKKSCQQLYIASASAANLFLFKKNGLDCIKSMHLIASLSSLGPVFGKIDITSGQDTYGHLVIGWIDRYAKVSVLVLKRLG